MPCFRAVLFLGLTISCVEASLAADAFVEFDGDYSSFVLESPIAQSELYAAFSIDMELTDQAALASIEEAVNADPKRVTEFRDVILRLWAQIEPSRIIFDRCVAHDVFQARVPDVTALDMDLRFNAARNIAKIYSLNALLNAEDGEFEACAAAITTQSRMAWMIIRSSLTLVEGMIGAVLHSEAVKGAIRCINVTKGNQQLADVLFRSFAFLKPSDTTLTRFLSLEFLYGRARSSDRVELQKSIDFAASLFGDCELELQVTADNYNEEATTELFYVTYKQLALAADAGDRDEFKKIIASALEPVDLQDSNAVGKLLLKMALPAFDKILVHLDRTGIQSDLLRSSLVAGFGGEPSEGDAFVHSSFAFDEERYCFYSSGFDGVFGSDDDVHLP